MSNWNNREWAALCSGEACLVCLDGKPHDIIVELAASSLTREKWPMRGYCCLVLKQHTVELYELETEEASALMRDIQQVAKAIREISGVVKINSETHGNTTVAGLVRLNNSWR